ncbi:MAG: DUF2380 domain-containing protein [Methylococcales bacterium]
MPSNLKVLLEVQNFLIILLLSVLFHFAQAAPRIAILDFELNDLTLAPRIPSEIKRTASIKGFLENELKSAGYEIVSLPLDDQTQANAGFGYLFDHHDIAAELAKKVKAGFVLVGRLHKPSFLFAYLIGHLIRVDNAQLIGNYIVETKGGDQSLTQKAVESLAVKIDQSLDKRYRPPLPTKKADLYYLLADPPAFSLKPTGMQRNNPLPLLKVTLRN